MSPLKRKNMKGRKRKPLKEGHVYCSVCHGNGKVKPYKSEFMLLKHLQTSFQYDIFSYVEPNKSARPKMKKRGRRRKWRISNECPKCRGIGQFDWIDHALGKTNDPWIHVNIHRTFKPNRNRRMYVAGGINFPIIHGQKSVGKSVFLQHRHRRAK